MTREEAKKHYERLFKAKADLWEIENAANLDNDGLSTVAEWIKAHVEVAMLEWDFKTKYDRECELVVMRDNTLKRLDFATSELERVQKELDEAKEALAWRLCTQEKLKP